MLLWSAFGRLAELAHNDKAHVQLINCSMEHDSQGWEVHIALQHAVCHFAAQSQGAFRQLAE